MDQKNDDVPFWEHVSQLRNVIIQSLLIILVSTFICIFFHKGIFLLLTKPLNNLYNKDSIVHLEFKRERIMNLGQDSAIHTIPSETTQVAHYSPGVTKLDSSRYLLPFQGYLDVDSLQKRNLVILGPIDGIAVMIKVCFWIGLVVASPFWIYLVLQFVAPAFEQNEWKFILPFLFLSFLFLGLGMLFSYFITIPLATQYLTSFNSGIAQNLWTLSYYLDFTLFLILANALAFELSLILFFLVHLKILTPKVLTSKRRHMMVAAFVLGAILTPPDIMSQLMLASLLIVIYELSILYARILQKANKATV
jgi:sec-independent protein translocase protein TatC